MVWMVKPVQLGRSGCKQQSTHIEVREQGAVITTHGLRAGEEDGSVVG